MKVKPGARGRRQTERCLVLANWNSSFIVMSAKQQFKFATVFILHAVRTSCRETVKSISCGYASFYSVLSSFFNISPLSYSYDLISDIHKAGFMLRS
jgi:hypothetical protein